MNIIKLYGFSLVELMVSMAIGSVLLAGVLTVYVNSNNAFHVSNSLNTLVSDARFATHLIRQDVQLSGSHGLAQKDASFTNTGIANIASDCAVQWFANITTNITGSNNTNPYSATCISAADGYVANSDVLVIRYADPAPVADADIVANTVYSRNNLGEGILFTNAIPALSNAGFTAQNNQYNSVAYYISDHTDSAGDGYPSLHRIRLVAGPALEDEVVVPGVQDMQIQYGFDSDDDGSVDQYINADNPIIDWTFEPDVNHILSISLSLLLVAETPEAGLNTAKTFNYADKQVVVANDGKFRRLITTVIPLNNQLRSQ